MAPERTADPDNDLPLRSISSIFLRLRSRVLIAL
jgi:hypothetical protein